jgi:hypothetical protein
MSATEHPERRAPGPAPWYIPVFPNLEPTSDAGLSWRRANLRHNPDECVVLLDSDKNLLVVVGIYSYAFVVNFETLLLWRAYEQGDAALKISFHLLALPALKPIRDTAKASEQTQLRAAGIYYESTPIDLWTCSAAFSEGENIVLSPPSFQRCGEVLVLADLGKAASASPINIAVLAFDFGKQRVTCLPQDWFNESNADFGYQWITRVWRDQKGRLCGDGIRIDPFRLDGTGRRRDDRRWARL